MQSPKNRVKTAQLTVRMTENIERQLMAYAEDQEMAPAEVIRNLIRSLPNVIETERLA